MRRRCSAFDDAHWRVSCSTETTPPDHECISAPAEVGCRTGALRSDLEHAFDTIGLPHSVRTTRRMRAMGDRSSIEWTEATWNPTTGCDRVSPGCDNCYALTLAKRLKAMGAAQVPARRRPPHQRARLRGDAAPDALDSAARWRRPRSVFVNSMSDLFHAQVPIEFIREVFDVMADTPQHTYQVLTKRAAAAAPARATSSTGPRNVWMGVSRRGRRAHSTGSTTCARCRRRSGSCPASRCSARCRDST